MIPFSTSGDDPGPVPAGADEYDVNDRLAYGVSEEENGLGAGGIAGGGCDGGANEDEEKDGTRSSLGDSTY